MGAWNAKEIYQQGGHLYDFKEGQNSQPTIKPNFISGALVPYLHGHVNFF